MSHTFVEFKEKFIRVHETPLIFSCLFLIKVNEGNFDIYFPNVKQDWFYQFEFNNWGGIDLELNSFLITEELQEQFVLMIDKTIRFINTNTFNNKIDLEVISSFPVKLGMLDDCYPSHLLIELLNQLNSLFEQLQL